MKNRMEERLDIKVFKMVMDVNLPLARNANITASTGIGNLLVCFDGKNVYAKDYVEGKDPAFELLLNDLTLIEANPHLFERIDN
jgi:hypothetical protein